MNRLIHATIFALAAGCSLVSPEASIENRLVELGASRARAECLAGELADRLDRGDLRDVDEYLRDLDRADTPGSALDAVLSIDNERAARAFATASLSCALDAAP